MEETEMMNIGSRRGSGDQIIDIEEIEQVFRNGNFRRGFSMFDLNKDGRIDVHELKLMVRRLANNISIDIPHDVVVRILRMDDADNNGYLDYHEFVSMVNNPALSVLFQRYLTNYVSTVVPRRRNLHYGIDETDGEYENAYSCYPPPFGMLLISCIEIIFFAVDASYFDSINATGPFATALMYNPRKRYEIWRFLTYMLVHIGYLHLIVNLFVQILLGIPLEMVHKSWRVLIVYLAGVLAGSLGTSLTDPYVYLAGASGGVYALITAHIATIIMNWREMSFAIVQLAVFVIVTCIDFGTAIYKRYYLEMEEHIGYEAHFAGALAGLFVGIFILKNLEPNSCENRLWWISFILFLVFIVFATIWNLAYTTYYPKPI